MLSRWLHVEALTSGNMWLNSFHLFLSLRPRGNAQGPLWLRRASFEQPWEPCGPQLRRPSGQGWIQIWALLTRSGSSAPPASDLTCRSDFPRPFFGPVALNSTSFLTSWEFESSHTRLKSGGHGDCDSGPKPKRTLHLCREPPAPLRYRPDADMRRLLTKHSMYILLTL